MGDMLSYYKNFERTQWAELPAAAIKFYTLPLIMQKRTRSTCLTFEFPALWKHEVYTDAVRGVRLNVFIKARSKIKLMDININQWYPGYQALGTDDSCCNPAGDCKCRPCPPYDGHDYVKLLSTFHRSFTKTLGTTGTDIRLVYNGTSPQPSVYLKCPFYMDFKSMERKHFRPVTGKITCNAPSWKS